MTKVLTDPKYYTAIANAIRAKNGSTAIYKPSGMAAAISAIQVDGGVAAAPKVKIKPTANQKIIVRPELSHDYTMDSIDGPAVVDGYILYDPWSVNGVLQLNVSVTADEKGYLAGGLIINGEAVNQTTAVIYPHGDVTIEAEDAQPISNFMPESYAVLYQKDAGYIVRVVSPSLSGGEEAGTVVPGEGPDSLLCNVTDSAFNVISGMKMFTLTGGGVYGISATLQKGTPVSADAPYGESIAIFAASELEAKAVMDSLNL